MEPHQQLAEFLPGAGERGGLSHRLATVSRIEWVLLLTRYVLYLFVVSLQVSGIETLPPGSLLLAAAAALAALLYTWIFAGRTMPIVGHGGQHGGGRGGWGGGWGSGGSPGGGFGSGGGGDFGGGGASGDW